MWKYRTMILRSISKSVDPITGDITDTNTDVNFEGFITPSSYVSAFSKVEGFQQGVYACFANLPSVPVINKDHIIDGVDDYLIISFEFWKEKNLYVLEIKK